MATADDLDREGGDKEVITMQWHAFKCPRSWMVAIFVFLIAAPEVVLAQTTADIYNWVAKEFEISHPPKIPPVRYVDKATLKTILKQSELEAYHLRQPPNKSDQAKQKHKRRLDDVVGLFDPKQGIVYVGDFLPDCRKRATLAHEFVHFFQFHSGAFELRSIIGQDYLRSVLEFQAHSIEQRFTKTHCR